MAAAVTWYSPLTTIAEAPPMGGRVHPAEPAEALAADDDAELQQEPRIPPSLRRSVGTFAEPRLPEKHGAAAGAGMLLPEQGTRRGL